MSPDEYSRMERLERQVETMRISNAAQFGGVRSDLGEIKSLIRHALRPISWTSLGFVLVIAVAGHFFPR
jgi:hypothetical protein